MTSRVEVSEQTALPSTMHAVGASHVVVGPSTPEVPDDAEQVINWLGRARLLFGVPFEYIVPDDGLLRTETMRTFHLERNWTDALVDGAMSAATFGTRDRVSLQRRHALIRDAVDDSEREQWQKRSTVGDTATVTGFLMRSRAVSGWPGMHIRAFRGARQLVPVRIERLSPGVMLAMFDDEPDRMEIEEPRQGIQFGVEAKTGDGTGQRWQFKARKLDGSDLPGAPIPTPFRKDSAGVIHMTELVSRVEDALSMSPSTLRSSQLAQQLVRYPYRQRFGDPGSDTGGGGGLGDRPVYEDVLVAEVDVDKMNLWHERFAP